MGLLDRFLPGGSPTYKEAPVDGVLGAWTAARTGAGLSLAGGQVALTPDALVFSPWDMDKTRAWLVKWLGKAGVPHTEDVNKLIDRTGLLEPLVLPLGNIANVHRLNRASLLKPPQARIALHDGRSFDLGILASVGTPNLSSKNNDAFDDWLAKLRSTGVTVA